MPISEEPDQFDTRREEDEFLTSHDDEVLKEPFYETTQQGYISNNKWHTRTSNMLRSDVKTEGNLRQAIVDIHRRNQQEYQQAYTESSPTQYKHITGRLLSPSGAAFTEMDREVRSRGKISLGKILETLKKYKVSDEEINSNVLAYNLRRRSLSRIYSESGLQKTDQSDIRTIVDPSTKERRVSF